MSKRTSGLFWAVFVFSLAFLLCGQLVSAQNQAAPFKDFSTYLQWMQKNHKAPFDRDGAALPPGGRQALLKSQAAARAAKATAPLTLAAAAYKNRQVNQDHNPWPKAEVAAAIDPLTGNWVVMTNDFRENFDQMFFHVSTNNGKAWTDDKMVGGSDPFTGFIPSTFQSDPGLSFDSSGNSYLSTITGNLILDFFSGYENVDTEIDMAQGFADGTFAGLLPTPIDVQPCNGLFTGPFTCDAALDKPFVMTDSNLNSPNYGTTYVYYTLFCNFTTSGFCTDGTAQVPSFQSAIVESHSPGPGQSFSAPALVSGTLLNTQFSNMVIDANGTPHIFFDDFSTFGTVNMWESTFNGSSWVVSPNPTVSFAYNGLNNSFNWSFRDSGAEAPGCGIYQNTAYCAFSANRIGAGKLEATPSVYLAAIDTATGIASHVVRVNNDPFNDQKDHFFAWATTTPIGHVFVGWYDNRNDPFRVKVDYFVGRSTDGGKTFPTQKAVNDVSFNPCTGFPGCGFFGDYTQLVSGPDGVVHAAWSDTRDGASMQLWSQAVCDISTLACDN
jgi:hypothetical protein